MRSGELNGVAWRSLTTKRELRSRLVIRKFLQYDRHGITLTLPEIISKLGFKDNNDFRLRPVSNHEVRLYYKSKAKFNNQKPVK